MPPGPIAADALLLAAAAARLRAGQRRGRGRAARGRAPARGRPRRKEARRQFAQYAAAGRRMPLDVSLLRRLARAELARADGDGRHCPGRTAGRAWPWSRPGAAGSAAWTCRPAPPRSARNWPPPACAWRWTAGPRRWCSPGWNARAPRRSGSGQCVRRADPQAAAALAELRQLSYLIRDAELAGHRDPAMVSQACRAAARDQGARAGRPSGLGKITPRRPASAR